MSINFLRKWIPGIGLVLILPLFIGSCGLLPLVDKTPDPKVTPLAISSVTPQVGELALAPLPQGTPGTTENPIVFGIVSNPEVPDAETGTIELGQLLTQYTGFQINVKKFESYSDLLSAMHTGSIQLSWLPPLTYIKAHREGDADVALLTNRFGLYYYGTQYFANKASGFTAYFDPTTNQNTVGSPAAALSQFVGKRPCWVEKTSASGYILPHGILVENNISTLDGVIAQNHVAVIRALYIRGICDFGVTFSHLGDPRTANAVQQDLSDVMGQIVIIWRSEPIIPNDNLSVHPQLPPEIRQKLVTTFLVLVKLEEGQAAIRKSTGMEIADLKIVEDTVYDPLRNMIQQTGSSLEDLVGK